MKKQYIHFVPKADAKKIVWGSNLKEKASVIGPQLGLSTQQVTELETASDTLVTAITGTEVKRKDFEESVKARNKTVQDSIQVIIRLAAQMKSNENYQDSLGSALGIVGSTRIFDLKEIKPIIKATAYSGRVDITFNLQVMKCITIYSRIKGTYGWEKLGNDYESPYQDTRPLAVPQQAEIREYMAFYFNGREDIGQPSDIVSAVYGG
ncbi:hypothetical protein SAMN05421788_1282 [Filimonas lacunae]|uniref:Uncharacterized protein n=2 Tax=Filimonas lacunae TaxID=477680 RepID=A0A173MBL8_9BACT|nr:hypothetical protein [Filimonas lacunae]BAV04881.1 hypothetical protein FLA_0881 [Filimonas lacunae]BAV05049.1 hypothetical protein FLA_1054 [Filimonas lacunae]SIT34827.1 hypothetical protein SAMN05421788_1282 [Filimonas lacunae]